ncbi:MAG: class A beta-lactamase, partial [Bacteroidetes bacterium]|nr:class A beta-lactamase [Candidatus Cryptobacteroides merdavium]
TNDIGIVFLPDGSHYTIAVFVKDSGETPEATAKMIADISQAVYECASAQ